MSALKLTELAARWAPAKAAERANFQSYLIELCEALEVERPRPAGSGYEFEYPVKVVNRDGTETTNFLDLYKKAHFLLEAKDQGSPDNDTILLRKAYGQARTYAAALEESPPPYLFVLDVGRTLLIWDRWNFGYGGFSAAVRINLTTLSDNLESIALLKDIFERPQTRNPNVRGTLVTREIAAQLAELAASLEDRGHEQESVARFLIRCVFTMFAEDVGLLPDQPFTHAIQEIGFTDPAEFTVALGDLWRAMDEGSRFGLRKFLRFNGHFFRDQTVIDLTREDLVILQAAASALWANVEPSIMGTLLTRALDPEERHRLGAEYTPREFVERVVRPTVEEPIRDKWTSVQAEVLQLRSGKKNEDKHKEKDRVQKANKASVDRLRSFHGWLLSLRFLDPACGSGNFLYVTLAIVKQVELEVMRAIEEITGSPELAVQEVGPWQFYGIEVKAWAREIAELTLWIGYHQWWRRIHGHIQPPEPVLQDTGTLIRQDAVLSWTSVAENPAKSKPDPTPRVVHSVTGNLVPDPKAVLPYMQYEGTKPTPWPKADFIIGNPPYMGSRRMRIVMGEGYTDAVQTTYKKVPNGADYVMLWWYRAAEAVRSGDTIRAGLITTNSIRQSASRRVVEQAETQDVRIMWAIPDHPWVDEAGSADVRVAMTVIARDPQQATLVRVDEQGDIVSTTTAKRLNADLTVSADVASATKKPLLANRGLAFMGAKLVGQGFVLEEDEARKLLAADSKHADIIKPFLVGRELTRRPKTRFVIDFGLRTEAEAQQYPVLFDIVRSRVKPERDANKGRYRECWWQFGVPNAERRQAAAGLSRVITTVETSKHRFFVFVSTDTVPDGTLITIASDDAFDLGVLSSRVHVEWALAAGGRLGVGNDPRYSNGLTFTPFPFPRRTGKTERTIADVAEQIDSLRWAALASDEKVTFTGIYNVIEKLMSGEPLTEPERYVHDTAPCATLRDLHDRLDSAVAAAYGWTWPMATDELLTRLVDLHDERVRAEETGTVEWLRPTYQRPNFASAAAPQELAMVAPAPAITAVMVHIQAWPKTVVEQIEAIQNALKQQPATIEEIAAQFAGSRRDVITKHVEILTLMGEARLGSDKAYHAVQTL